MPWITTTILLDRLHDAQDAAWEEFASHFRAPVHRFAVRLGLTESAAEDVVQSTMLAFVHGYQSGRYERGRGRLSSWLFGIAYREAMGALRGSGRERQGPRGDEARTGFFEGRADEASARVTWTESWERHVLDRCLDRVRGEVEPTTYEAFELSTVRGVPPVEVARELGMTKGAVYVAKHRVLKRIGELRHDYDPETMIA